MKPGHSLPVWLLTEHVFQRMVFMSLCISLLLLYGNSNKRLSLYRLPDFTYIALFLSFSIIEIYLTNIMSLRHIAWWLDVCILWNDCHSKPSGHPLPQTDWKKEKCVFPFDGNSQQCSNTPYSSVNYSRAAG